MPRIRPSSYLISQRLGAALSQRELGLLLGYSDDAISLFERDLRTPSAELLIGTQLLFGLSPDQLFPAFCTFVEDSVGRNALVLHNRLAGSEDRASRKKLALIEGIAGRLQPRSQA